MQDLFAELIEHKRGALALVARALETVRSRSACSSPSEPSTPTPGTPSSGRPGAHRKIWGLLTADGVAASQASVPPPWAAGDSCSRRLPGRAPPTRAGPPGGVPGPADPTQLRVADRLLGAWRAWAVCPRASAHRLPQLLSQPESQAQPAPGSQLHQDIRCSVAYPAAARQLPGRSVRIRPSRAVVWLGGRFVGRAGWRQPCRARAENERDGGPAGWVESGGSWNRQGAHVGEGASEGQERAGQQQQDPAGRSRPRRSCQTATTAATAAHRDHGRVP